MATYSFQDVQANIVGPGAAFSIGAGAAASGAGGGPTWSAGSEFLTLRNQSAAERK